MRNGCRPEDLYFTDEELMNSLGDQNALGNVAFPPHLPLVQGKE